MSNKNKVVESDEEKEIHELAKKLLEKLVEKHSKLVLTLCLLAAFYVGVCVGTVLETQTMYYHPLTVSRVVHGRNPTNQVKDQNQDRKSDQLRMGGGNQYAENGHATNNRTMCMIKTNSTTTCKKENKNSKTDIKIAVKTTEKTNKNTKSDLKTTVIKTDNKSTDNRNKNNKADSKTNVIKTDNQSVNETNIKTDSKTERKADIKTNNSINHKTDLKKDHKKDLKTDIDIIHEVFSGIGRRVDSPVNEIANFEMELEISNVIWGALELKGIYLLYGQNGIGKTVALKRCLTYRWDPIPYVYIANGMKGLLKLLTPHSNKDRKREDEHDIYEIITEALLKYSDYRRAK
jgi:hypothetical protein